MEKPMQATLLCALLLTPDAPPPVAAMVLRAGAGARLQPGEGKPARLRAMDLLYPGDRLEVPKQGEVPLIFAHDGHKEGLRPGSKATVGETGCTPAEAVAIRETPKLSRANLTTLKQD